MGFKWKPFCADGKRWKGRAAWGPKMGHEIRPPAEGHEGPKKPRS
jgi:hypothetical protein